MWGDHCSLKIKIIIFYWKDQLPLGMVIYY